MQRKRRRERRTWRTGHIFQRGEVWWIGYRLGSHQHRESSRSSDREVAEQLLRRRLVSGPDSGATFDLVAENLLDDYRRKRRRSTRRAQQALAHLTRYFGADALAKSVTPKKSNDYVDARIKAGAKPATVAYEIAILRRAYTLALRDEFVTVRPAFEGLPVNNARQGFVETAELTRILRGLPEDVRAMVEFLGITGWRRGEAEALQWSQVDRDSRTVRLLPGRTKSGEGRAFPFGAHPRLAALLREQRERTEAHQRATGSICRLVFHRAGQPIVDFRDAWTKACAAAGNPGLVVHDLRRSAVRNLVRAGLHEGVAMKLTGHKTRAVFDRYNITSERDLTEGVEKLAAFHEREASGGMNTE